MARAFDELLDEDAVVAEAGKPLALHALERLAHVLLGISEPHPLAATAGRGLHHHRIADAARDLDRVIGVPDLADEARHYRHARRLRQLLGLDLVEIGRASGRERVCQYV